MLEKTIALLWFSVFATVAISLLGCVDTMEPVAPPLVQGRLDLCSSKPEPPPKDLATNPNYIEYSVEVIDSANPPTNGLKQSDFSVVQNGASVPIAFFRENHSRPPASIGILIDKSDSMVSKLPIVKSTVTELLKKIDPCDEVFLYAFGAESALVQDFTTDHDLLNARLEAVHANGRTPLFDSLKVGIDRLQNGHYPDKVLIVFTDGGLKWWLGSSGPDNASKNVKQDDLTAIALNSQSRIFIVGVGNPNASHVPATINIGSWSAGSVQEGIDAESLRKLANGMGAESIFIFSSADENAPKVSIKLRPRQPEWLFNTPTSLKFPPLTIDASQVDQVATSIASQVDDHYTIGIIAPKSSSGVSTAPELTIRIANVPTAVARMRQVQLAPSL